MGEQSLDPARSGGSGREPGDERNRRDWTCVPSGGSTIEGGRSRGMDPGDVAATIGNPFYAVNIDPDLAAAHDPIVFEEEWVAANARLVGEIGPESCLRNLLLAVLKGAFPRRG
ncbi:hypothetical protein GCM10010429_30980 [Micromonospora olivasterospora]